MPTRFKQFTAKRRKQLDSFMARRPHRSFRRTRRRDYVRPLELPGNIAFTHQVTKFLWGNKKIFFGLAAVYAVTYAVLVGIQSQENYSSVSDLLGSAGEQVLGGDWSSVGQASLLLVSTLSNGFGSDITEAQQIFLVLIFLMVWLSTVWLVRNILAGHRVRLRDGIYNSGSPIFGTLLVTVLLGVQLLPVALAALGYSAASETGLIASGGVAAMLFWLGVGLLGLLSLYWITSTLFALIIVTLPGMYPWQAIKTAGDMMVGRRLKILLRWAWMALVVAIATAAVLIPVILIDMGLKWLLPAISGVPVVPVALVAWSACVTVWIATYVYMLYRKVVDYVPAE